MARWSFGVRLPADWRRRAIGVGLLAVGFAGVGTASWLYVDAWASRAAFDASPEAAALQQQADAPTPIWTTPEPASVATEAIAPVPTQGSPDIPLFDVVPTPAPTASADQLSLDAADFRFLDPPEPGAHARIAFTVSNHASVTSSRILLGIDSSWFDGYSIIGSAPAVTEDRTDDSGLRTFSFPPISPQESATYELHVTSTKEGTTAPAITVLASSGDNIGEIDQPSTFAPPPRPGPVMAIDIPRLKLHSGVLQVGWEPPAFAVGQIEDTANVSQGNTVLVGHLTGLSGNVFADLDQLKLGDEITATSRGLPYKFVVSQTFEGANTDASPIDPEDDPRLTLMTCAGVWNPITHDYSKRLWVIAELPDQAAVTIANAQATATVVSGTATAQATLDAQATATANDATATAVALLPTATPVPTPFAGDPSQPGGIGNTRTNLEKAFGQASGETSGKLVVFHHSGGDMHVQFTPDPPRAQLVSEVLNPPLALDAARNEARKLLPTDTQSRTAAPEGNAQIVVERFTSALLGQALSVPSGDFSVIYTKNSAGAITAIDMGLGDDLNAIQSDASR
ncbi:MAG TPA: sortase [Chloroflexota bacterium]